MKNVDKTNRRMKLASLVEEWEELMKVSALPTPHMMGVPTVKAKVPTAPTAGVIAPPKVSMATPTRPGMDPSMKLGAYDPLSSAQRAQESEAIRAALRLGKTRSGNNLDEISIPRDPRYLQAVMEDPTIPTQTFGKTTPFKDLIAGRRLAVVPE